ncbi:MAG: DUF2029 domain-containing protein [Acetobacteraceae bacterium]|nr:DUF2029 domain-containing protein [Acetobacteraceae bacterium]
MNGAARMRAAWRNGVRLDGPAARAALALVLAAGVFVAWRIGARQWPVIASGNKVFSDLFAHWSYAGFAAAHPGPAIYDREAMSAFQHGLFDGRLQGLPFAYPPPYLFLVLPLAAFTVWHAALLWGAASLAAFAAAIAPRPWRADPLAPSLLVLAILAPSTIVCLGYGQNGLLIAALLAGGLRLLPTRPGWGGVLLALACVKPQMAVLLPVALLAGRQWRAIAAAVATGLLLVLASAAWIGPLAWIDWIAALREQGDYAARWIGPHRQPTVAATMTLFGMDRASGLAVQAAVTTAVVLGVVAAWRRGPSAAAAGAVLAGALLATPYGFNYDLPVATAAVAALVAGRRRVSWPEAAVMAATLLLPMVLHLTSRFFWTAPVTLAALFVLCVWRACSEQERLFFF